MHRYIPVLAKNEGFTKIGEKVVQHQARKYGETKFGMDRFVNGFLDLITIAFLSKFGKRPMHFFGLWGSIVFAVGFIAAAYIGVNENTQIICRIKNHFNYRQSLALYFFNRNDYWNTIIFSWFYRRAFS